MDATKPAIEIKNLYKIYGHSPHAALETMRSDSRGAEMPGHFVALRNINLSIEPGKICVIMGLSGSGKSTLLRCINRLVDPTGGQILIGGREITGASRKELRHIRLTTIGMVFQHFALLPHMSVVDNVAFGLRIAGVPRRERRERASKALELVGLSGWNHRKPSSLSGGMRQRVGLARALVMDTPVLLMDEPFSALDPLIREEMQQELLRLQATLNKTIVFVTHDPNEAATLGDRVAILLKGEVVQEGHPMDIVLSPANDYVRNFVRGIDVFKVLTAGQVIDAGRPAIVLNGDTVSAMPLIRRMAGDAIAVTDGDGRLLGVVQEPLSASAPAAEWKRHLSQDFTGIGPGDLIAPFLDILATNARPIAVVRENGAFVGLITGNSLLKALAANIPAQTTKPQPSVTASREERMPDEAQRAGAGSRN